MIKAISSVSEGYLVCLKIDLPSANLETIRIGLQDLGYTILTDNADMLFCKHITPYRDYELVKQDFASVFGFQPRLFTDLGQFFERNGL